MKTSIKTLAILLITFLFTAGCNNGDDTNAIGDLVGTWKITSASTINCTDPDLNDPTGSELFGCVEDSGLEICLETFFVFEAGGTITIRIESTLTLIASGTSQMQSESQTQTFTIDNGVLDICEGNDCESVNYTINGNTLQVTGTDSELGCEISITLEKQQ